MTENHKLENNFFYISPFKDGEGRGWKFKTSKFFKNPKNL